MNEEQIALETLKEVASDDFDTLGDDISPKMAQNILNVIDRQQKEINFYKNEELGYLAGYEDGKKHKQTAVAIKNENAQQELFQKEIVRLKEIISNQQKEIEENQVLIDDIKDHRIVYIDTPEFEEKFISKDKIREKLNYFEHSFDYDDDGTSYELVMEVLDELLEEK